MRRSLMLVIALAACGSDDRPAAPIDAKHDAAAASPIEAVSDHEPVATPRGPGTPLPADCAGSQAAPDLAAADAPGATLEQRIASVVPTPAEEKFLTVPWRTNLMAARDEAQDAGKPVFLWIMVGNPQGCT